MMKEFWDERYAEKEYVYGTEPNEYFRSFIDTLKPGSILLPAEGEGRNAVYAATRGWQVTAFDFSTKGREKALALAKQYQVSINYQLTDYDHFISDEKFDLVVLLYGHFGPEDRQKYHRKICNFIKPGGILMLEAFSKEQIHNNTGGPKNADALYNKEMLENDFADLQITTLEEVTKELKEGDFHNGKANIIRLIAAKSK